MYKCSPFIDCDAAAAVIIAVGDGGGGQCSADSASQSSESSSAASLSKPLFISTSLYSGLFNFNHCKAASTFAGQTYWYMCVPCSTAFALASLEPSVFEMEALGEGYTQE